MKPLTEMTPEEVYALYGPDFRPQPGTMQQETADCNGPFLQGCARGVWHYRAVQEGMDLNEAFDACTTTSLDLPIAFFMEGLTQGFDGFPKPPDQWGDPQYHKGYNLGAAIARLCFGDTRKMYPTS